MRSALLTFRMKQEARVEIRLEKKEMCEADKSGMTSAALLNQGFP